MGSSIYELSDNTALYEVLGVPRTATDKDIRRAYLKLVVIYHPDKNPDGEEIFKEICFAHSVLSDPKQRAMYDSRSLRQNLQGRANEYDPAMDPRVQLSPEDLRKFVEKIQSEQSAKAKQQNAFERMLEEEMRRRAEYDAKNPAFKAQYERDRQLRQQQTAASAAEPASRQAGPTSTSYLSRDPSAQAIVAPRSTGTGASAGLKGYRTCAELTASLEEDERNRLYGLPTTSTINKNNAASAASTSSSSVQPSGLSVRQQMMSKYRTEKAVVTSGGSTNSSRGSGTPARTTKLDFVKEQDQQGSYVKTVDEAIRTYSHFDYLDYVTAGRRDQEPIAGAVIADALDSYARTSEDPKALD